MRAPTSQRGRTIDLTISEKAQDLVAQTKRFVKEVVYPAEPKYDSQRRDLMAAGRCNEVPAVLDEVTEEARSRGLWNLFLPSQSGLSTLDYASVAEETGHSPWIAPAAMNCLSPDSGNMELLEIMGTESQQEEWLAPLLDGRIRSAFAMTEPSVASSDATNISLRATRHGDDYILDGRKWWTTGAADPRCELLIVMGRTATEGPRYRQHTLFLVPRDATGVIVDRVLPVFGYFEQQGHAEVSFEGVRVPAANILGQENEGFAAAQARLGPGRVHHCMRAIGMAERALRLTCERASSRRAFGKVLADQGVIREGIARSRLAIDQARLLVKNTARLIDTVGAQSARYEVSAIKAVVPRMAAEVIDRAIQVHGGAGVTEDFPLAALWSRARTLRIADGPDEVHMRSIARQELKRYEETPE